jgi:hypothetical protein
MISFSHSSSVPGKASLLACVWLAVVLPASAAIVWPAVWSHVYGSGGGLYADGTNQTPTFVDPNYSTPPTPEYTDLVGGVDSTLAGPFAGGLWATSADFIYFRMRVDNEPSGNPQTVWQVLINTDADEYLDWAIQLDLSSDNQVELAQNLGAGGGPSDNWTNVNLSLQVAAGTPATDFYRYVNATAATGSNFHALNDDDYFIDMAFPKSIFLTQTGLAFSETFGVAFATSASHTVLNKDLPDTGWGAIPEPSVVLLSLLASCTALARRKR